MARPAERRWRARLAVGVAGALLCACVSYPHGLIGRDAADTARRIRAAVPDGTDLATAIARMRSGGYRCQIARQVPYTPPGTGPARHAVARTALFCGRYGGVSHRGGYMFSDEFKAIFSLDGGGTLLISASVDAAYP